VQNWKYNQSTDTPVTIGVYADSLTYEGSASEPKTQSAVSENEQATDSVVAIIPAYNESEALDEVIQEAKPYVDKVVVINDASTDATETIASKHADGVVTHRQNTGVGGAVHTGYQVAIRDGFDTVIQIDGDGQHDPSYIPKILSAMEEGDADMVIGSRWLNGSHEDYSTVRRAGIRFFTFEANILGGLSITDVTSGFRAYDVEMLTDLRRPNNSHWALEQTLEAARKGYDLSEVSVPMPPATKGSQFDLGTLLAYPLRMVLITLKVLLYR
jgi:glycosyltransferase involved in cell wall biosynthesis